MNDFINYALSAGGRWITSALLCFLVVVASQAQSADSGLALLEAEISRLSEALDGVAGVSVRHLETGQEMHLNGDVRFPMASTYKVPIAVQILTMVDRGELKLDQKYKLKKEDFLETHSAIVEHLLPGSELTTENLLSMMLRYSDNVATDIMLRMAGGSAAVTARMRELGLEIRVDRPTWAIILNFLGETGITESSGVSAERNSALLAERSGMFDNNDLTNPFYADSQDTATPSAMAKLITGVWEKTFLSSDSAQRLLDIMYGTTTGPGRLKGMLPPGTRVAHKTGTIGLTANDVGIIELPHKAGHVVVVVFTKLSRLQSLAPREAVIAQIARAVHDYFVFHHGLTRADGPRD